MREHSTRNRKIAKKTLTGIGNHVLNNLDRLLHNLTLTISQLLINNPLQLLHNPGRKQRQVRRDVIPNNVMRDTTIDILMTLQHTHQERPDPSKGIYGVPEGEGFVHEDFSDHRARDDGEVLVEGLEVEDGAVFFFAAEKELVLVLIKFFVVA